MRYAFHPKEMINYEPNILDFIDINGDVFKPLWFLFFVFMPSEITNVRKGDVSAFFIDDNTGLVKTIIIPRL